MFNGKFQSCGLAVLRIAVGAVILTHGYQKVFHMHLGGVAGFFGHLGIPLPTLSAIVVILGLLLIAIAHLSTVYGVAAMDQTQTGYQSVLSQLCGAVVGRGALYYVAIGSLLCVLALSQEQRQRRSRADTQARRPAEQIEQRELSQSALDHADGNLKV